MINRRTYRFGKSQLIIEFGDITTSKAQALVSSDDYYLSMGGGVSDAIRKAGGNAVVLDATKKVPASLGDVVVTTAGALPAQYIFHAVTIGPPSVDMLPDEIIRQTTQHCMKLLDVLGLHSIAFPAIGAGVAGFDYGVVAAQMAEVITDDLLKRKKPTTATIYLFDRFGRMQPVDFVQFFEEFAVRAPRVTAHETSGQECETAIPKTAPVASKDLKPRRLHHLRKLIGSLEDQRYKLEEHLIDCLGIGGGEVESKEVRQNLMENEELRLKYLNELKNLSDKGTDTPMSAGQTKKIPPSVRTVFVSSTYLDLADHRAAVKDQITRRDLLFRGMEHFGADHSHLAPAAKIIEEVRSADAYIGIFGVRYGSVDQVTGLSMTELEFNEAKAIGKPMFLYVIRDDASVKVSDVETDTEGKAKLDDLKARILQNHIVYRFSGTEDLSRQVYEDLGNL